MVSISIFHQHTSVGFFSSRIYFVAVFRDIYTEWRWPDFLLGLPLYVGNSLAVMMEVGTTVVHRKFDVTEFGACHFGWQYVIGVQQLSYLTW